MSNIEQQIELLEEKLQTCQNNARNLQISLEETERQLRKVQRDLTAEKARTNALSHAGSGAKSEKQKPDVEKLRDENQASGSMKFADTAFSSWSFKDPWRSSASLHTPARSTGFGSDSPFMPQKKVQPAVLSKPTISSAHMANKPPRTAKHGETGPMAASFIPGTSASTDLCLSRFQAAKLEPSLATCTKPGQPKQKLLNEKPMAAGLINRAVSVPRSPVEAGSYMNQRPLPADAKVSRSPSPIAEVYYKDLAPTIAQGIAVKAEAGDEDEDSDDSEVIARNLVLVGDLGWSSDDDPISAWRKPSIPGQPKQMPLDEKKETAGSINRAVSVPKLPMDTESYTQKFNPEDSETQWGGFTPRTRMSDEESDTSDVATGLGEADTALVTSKRRLTTEPFGIRSSKRPKPSPTGHR